MTELKSRAHPDWPYTGTPWEWRGFRVAIAREKVMRNHSEVLAYLAESERKDAVYQKQNFGPELK
jgi:hypothetical protein